MATPYDDLINQAAAQYGIDPDFVKAIISVESNWNPNAVRPEPQINDASYGLMQVLLTTARRVSGNSTLTAQQLLTPAVNITVGTAYIRELQDKYGGYPEDIASAYNAGKPAHNILLGPLVYSNQGYVTRVMAAYSWEKKGSIAIVVFVAAAGLAFWWVTRAKRAPTGVVAVPA